MYNGIIHFNNYKVSAENLLSGQYDQSKISKPLLNACDFIIDWLLGKSEFELRTSGSTGSPKKIMISRGQMEASASQTIKTLSLDHSYTSLVAMDTRFIGAKMMIVRSLMAEMDLVILNPSANPLQSLPAGLSPDFIALVPLQLQAIISTDIQLLNNFKIILVGGAPITNNLKQKVKNLNSIIYHAFGMTETVSHIALRRINGENPSGLYTAFDNVELGIDDRGCLTIKSEITANRTIITNDLVEIVNPRQFRWLGRIDNVINSGGIKIQVEDLEDKINELNILTCKFIVAGIPDETYGEKVILILETDQMDPETKGAILLEIASKVGKYHQPKEIHCIPNFTYSGSGKIDRNKTISLLTF